MLWIVGGAAVAVVVAVVAYGIGFNNGQAGAPSGPFVGRGFGMMAGYGYYGFLGLLGPLLFIGLLVGLVWLVVAPGPRRDANPPADRGPGLSSGVDQLQQLADLHARGELSDEEYAAAKRRLLGM